MLNSKEYNFITYEDERAKRDADFDGGSGFLYLATHKKTGKKWLVKHTYSYNASNEFVACWLAGKLGVYTPTYADPALEVGMPKSEIQLYQIHTRSNRRECVEP